MAAIATGGLIGVTGGTTVVSSILTSGAGSTGSQAGAIAPPRRVRTVVKPSPKDAALSDLVYGETEEDDGVVDSTRVQTIAITGVLAAIYFNLMLEATDRIGGLTAHEAVTTGKQVFASMPPVGATFMWLLGLSHATLLSGKLLGAYKAPAAPAPTR